jgi:cytochrome c-type biogenesis protein CcmH/NrfG
LESQQRWDLALEAYRAAARLNPTNSEVMYRMGVVLKNLRSYSEATDALRKAVQLNPSNLPAHKLLSAVMALGLVYGLPELAPDKR